tara:strand:+ start:1504 stop:1686 length:183 start_codon:yes stop_codon:yes gene_type:complete
MGVTRSALTQRITGSTTAVNDLAHPPVFVYLLCGQIVVAYNHGHAWSHFQAIGRSDSVAM